MPRVGVTGVTKVSGQVVLVSGQVVKISGESVAVTGLDFSTQSGQQVITTVDISGSVVRITTVSGYIHKVSGETIIAKISGEAVKISGEMVSLPATQVVKVSGETVIAKVSGEAVKISGEVVDIKVPTSIRTGPERVCAALSGGLVLHSGAVLSVTVKALAGNSGPIYVGGDTAPNMPYSGVGFRLAAGEACNMDVDDFSAVYLFSTVSGDVTTFMGIN